MVARHNIWKQLQIGILKGVYMYLRTYVITIYNIGTY